MYSSSYSRTKFGLEAREPLHKPKGKSCGYYVKIIFFFSSLIQSLIIVTLVLFLIYGQPKKSAEEKRVEELQLGFNRLSDNNIQLRKEKSELGAQLEARTAEKAALEKEIEKLKTEANSTEFQLKMQIESYQKQIMMSMRRSTTPILPPIAFSPSNEVKTLNAQLKAKIELIEANFTQTVNYLSQERDNALKDRNMYHQEAINLNRESTMLKEQLTTYTRKCKEDFSQSLNGISTVTKDFLERISNLFPHQMTFHLTCESQQEYMEKIRNSCTNLSRDVENKFQLYLHNVGNKVSEIQALSSRLEVQNSHMSADLKQCENNRSETIAETAKQLDLKQKAHDDKVEKLLTEQGRLRDQKKLLEDSLNLKDRELMMCQQKNPVPFKPVFQKPGGFQSPPQTNLPSPGASGIGKR